MADVPYVGCGVLASSCGMDKVTMKMLFREANLPICKHIWFLRAEWERERAQVCGAWREKSATLFRQTGESGFVRRHLEGY
jgi:D-alanine-D-alanine ligase